MTNDCVTIPRAVLDDVLSHLRAIDGFTADDNASIVAVIRALTDAALAVAPQDEPACGYACRLAESMYRKFYAADAPDWQVCDDLMGVLTQIDNMMSGLVRAPDALREALK